MDTLYIHKATGNIQLMTDATWEILGKENSGWSIATEEEIKEQNAKLALEKPKPIIVELPKANAKTATVEIKPAEQTATPKATTVQAESKPKVAQADEEAGK